VTFGDDRAKKAKAREHFALATSSLFRDCRKLQSVAVHDNVGVWLPRREMRSSGF
jgi:hypothetical protein